MIRRDLEEVPNHLTARLEAARRVPVRPAGLRYAVTLGELRADDDLALHDLDQVVADALQPGRTLAAVSTDSRNVPALVERLAGSGCRVVGRIDPMELDGVRRARDRAAAMAADGVDEGSMEFPAALFRAGDRTQATALISAVAAGLAGRPLTVVMDPQGDRTAARLDEATRLAAIEGAAFVQPFGGTRPWPGAFSAMAVALEVLRGRLELEIGTEVGVKLAGMDSVQEVIWALALADAMLGRLRLRPGSVRVVMSPNLLGRVSAALG